MHIHTNKKIYELQYFLLDHIYIFVTKKITKYVTLSYIDLPLYIFSALNKLHILF